ncbi:MAG TPA: hypothetical protein VIL09_02135 [Microvirga sp.]
MAGLKAKERLAAERWAALLRVGPIEVDRQGEDRDHSTQAPDLWNG